MSVVTASMGMRRLDAADAGLFGDGLLQVAIDKRSFFDGTCHYLFFLFTMNLSVRLLLRVLKPSVGLPHGVIG